MTTGAQSSRTSKERCMSENDLGRLQNLFGNFIGPLIDLIFWNDPHPQARLMRSCY